MAAVFFISLVISGAYSRDPVKLAAPVAIVTAPEGSQ